VTNKNPKKPPKSYRAPTNGSAAPTATKPRGLLGNFLAPRPPGTSSMPKIPASLLRGLVAVIGTPAIVIAVPLFLLLEWVIAIALGFQGPFSVFVSALALPPVGTGFDFGLSTSILGVQSGLLLGFAFVIFRAALLGVVLSALVQILDEDRLTWGSVPRGLRILPVSLAVGILEMLLLTVSSILTQVLGGGIGLLLQIGLLVVGLYLLVYAPVAAVAERRGLADSLGRSVRAARMPGSGNLAMVAVYVVPALAFSVIPGLPGKLIGVNPSMGAWVLVILLNLAHLVFLAAFAFRYLCISDEVPEPRARPARPQRRR
jgi:hypothetical protein